MNNNTSFTPVFEVGLTNKQMPACRQVNTVSIDPAILAGMCISIIESVISHLDDKNQIQFEKETIGLFNYMVEARHGYTSTIKLNKNE